MEDFGRLETLRQENAQRWKTLKELHKQCNAAAATADSATTTPKNHRQQQGVALAVELDILRRHNQFPPNHHRSGSTTTTSSRERNCDFSQELLTSYDDLRQTNAVLERDMERGQQKLQETREMISQQKAVHKTLVSMISDTNLESWSQQDSALEGSNSDDHYQRENQWIKAELRYVSNLIDQRQRKKRRKETETRRTTDTSNNYWNIERLVLEFTKRYMTSPLDPYLDAKSFPVESQQHIELLKQSLVLECHPDDRELVCLCDYNAENAKR